MRTEFEKGREGDMSKFFLSFLTFFTSFSLSKDAFAYLDPGTGSMLLQMLLGGVAGVLVVGKLYWHRLKEMLPGARRRAPAETSSAEHKERPDRGAR